MKRLAISDSYENLSKLFGIEKVDDFLAAIGYGDINSQHIAQRILKRERKEQEREATWEDIAGGTPDEARRRAGEEGFTVQGVEGLLTHLGRCCNPVPGDSIIGYVTRGRGSPFTAPNAPTSPTSYATAKKTVWSTSNGRIAPRRATP